MELNRKNVRWLMLLITFALVLAWGINNPAQVGGILDRLLGLVSPFLLGFCFAFVLNILLRPLERLWDHLWRRSKSPLKQRLRRPVCLLLSLVVLFGVVAAVFLVLIPQLRAKYLTQSGKIIDIDCSNLVSVEKMEYNPNEDVYNMEVMGTHNFAVNGGVIVHNCMDDIRYFCNTIMKNKVRKESNYTPIFM